MIGTQDGDIQIKLKEDHKPTEGYVRELREKLPRLFPGVSFAFLPADIVSQILNFGAPAPSIYRSGVRTPMQTSNTPATYCGRFATFPALPMPASSNRRTTPASMSTRTAPVRNTWVYTTRDVTNAMVVNLAGSSQVAPTYYLES